MFRFFLVSSALFSVALDGSAAIFHKDAKGPDAATLTVRFFDFPKYYGEKPKIASIDGKTVAVWSFGKKKFSLLPGRHAAQISHRKPGFAIKRLGKTSCEFLVPGPGKYLWIVKYRNGRVSSSLEPLDAAASEVVRLADDEPVTSPETPPEAGAVIEPRYAESGPSGAAGSYHEGGEEVYGEEPDEIREDFGANDGADPLDDINDPDWRVRKRAAMGLVEFGDGLAVEALIGALRDPHKYVRGAAAEALGEIGNTRAVPPLIEALGDRFLHVRASTAKALGKLGDQRAIGPLRKASRDKSGVVRKIARKALHELGGQ
ncbi:HEAT repeat domain-containing protein [Elusimicrobiota bacterium]